MENKFESGFKCHPPTKEQQDQAFREFDRQQQKSLERLCQMLESNPTLRAQHEAARRQEHLAKFGALDFSSLEERVVAHDLPDNFTHTSGVVRGVVARYPRMSDNLPKDGNIKFEKHDSRLIQTDIYAGDVQSMSLSDGVIEAMGILLRPEQEQVNNEIKKQTLTIIDEAPFLTPTGHLPQRYFSADKGPVGPCGRALRVAPKDTWSAERRDRAATSAPARKKLRARTRAQKKARRKQR